MPTGKQQFLATTLCVVFAVVAKAAPIEEAPWREPGQIVTPDYLNNGTLRYAAEGREIVGRNRSCFNNRPLYCEPNRKAWYWRATGHWCDLDPNTIRTGLSLPAIVRGQRGKWFHEYSEVESRYRCGRMTWRISDSTLPGIAATLEAVPLKDATGFALRLAVQGQQAQDKLVWAFGGAGIPAAMHDWRGNRCIAETQTSARRAIPASRI